MSHFTKYIVTRTSGETDLPVFLYRNISRAAVFKATNSIRCYVEEICNPDDCWIVCYKEENIGDVDLQLELSGSGYNIIPYSDSFELYWPEEELQIPKLVGYIAFQECIISREVVEQFKLDFEPDLFDELLKRGAYIYPRLFELETNTDYIGRYILSYLTRLGIIPEDVIRIVKTRIELDELDLFLLDLLY